MSSLLFSSGTSAFHFLMFFLNMLILLMRWPLKCSSWEKELSIQLKKFEKGPSIVAQLCRLFATPRTAAFQAPPPMGFSRQEYWSGLPLPSPRVEHTALELSSLPDQGQTNSF